jgi:protein-disulfide isomerase
LNKISWIIFIVFTVGILVLLIIFSGNSQINVSKVDINTVQTGNNQNGNIADHVFGKVSSKVTLIEYGDFQCPGCGEEHSNIKTVIEQYKDQLQFVFRNYPLTSMHPNAKAAAAATEAAGLQGKYWEMHNIIYESQADWENLTGDSLTNMFISYAKSFGLDTTRFKTDLQSTAVSGKISYDLALGAKAGVDATPTFYLDGKHLDSSVWSNNTKLKDAIDAELKKAGIALP